MNYHTLVYAAGALLLGAVGIWFGDFAMQWQGVPKWIPAMPFAYVSGLILVVGGGLILARREKPGAAVLASFFGLWVVAFHLWPTLRNFHSIGAWNAPAESGFLAMGGLALFASSLADPLRATALRLARILAGACAMVSGSAHFNYIEFTATFVPAWIPPTQLFWAWATGFGHLLAGFALVSDTCARLAATCLAGMMGSFALLLHLPRVIATPGAHAEWIMLGMSSALAGAAWLIRTHATRAEAARAG
jgi:uncharacterized membrane protein YphA (DoxX/SURF4 family)